MSMGGIIAASMIAGRCLAPLGQVAGLLMQYQNARTSLGSIDNYMKLPIERPAEAEFLHRPHAAGAQEGVVQAQTRRKGRQHWPHWFGKDHAG
ncbi:hypothetical protein G6F24_018253 [Rhizopus arrhizus]|nr:hypothetical protein G6F24_018253 [Rhizopus arrhizus]